MTTEYLNPERLKLSSDAGKAIVQDLRNGNNRPAFHQRVRDEVEAFMLQDKPMSFKVRRFIKKNA